MLAYWAIQWRAARVSGLIFFRRAGRKRGIVWLGPPGTNTAARTRWQCKNGHLWVTTLAAIVNGHECPRCLGRARKTEVDSRRLRARAGSSGLVRNCQEHNDQDALRMCARPTRVAALSLRSTGIRVSDRRPSAAGQACQAADRLKLAGADSRSQRGFLHRGVCRSPDWACE